MEILNTHMFKAEFANVDKLQLSLGDDDEEGEEEEEEEDEGREKRRERKIVPKRKKKSNPLQDQL